MGVYLATVKSAQLKKMTRLASSNFICRDIISQKHSMMVTPKMQKIVPRRMVTAAMFGLLFLDGNYLQCTQHHPRLLLRQKSTCVIIPR